MLHCKEVVRILGGGQQLTLGEKVSLNLHLWMCKHCRAYARQLGAIKAGFIKLFQERTAISKNAVKEVEQNVLKAIDQAEKKK
jgi:hypothetical protein